MIKCGLFAVATLVIVFLLFYSFVLFSVLLVTSSVGFWSFW